MKKPIEIYDLFDVVLVPFPFIDTVDYKKRPALVLSSSTHFNSITQSSVLAMITTSSHSPWPLDVEIHDLKSAGLPLVSLVRMKLFTLDHRLILKKLGKLGLQDQKALRRSLSDLFSDSHKVSA